MICIQSGHLKFPSFFNWNNLKKPRKKLHHQIKIVEFFLSKCHLLRPLKLTPINSFEKICENFSSPSVKPCKALERRNKKKSQIFFSSKFTFYIFYYFHFFCLNLKTLNFYTLFKFEGKVESPTELFTTTFNDLNGIGQKYFMLNNKQKG